MVRRPPYGSSWVLLAVLAAGASAQAREQVELVDRVVALVNGDPILLSDVRRARSMAGPPGSAGSSGPTDRELLELIIDERVRLHEIERFEKVAVPLEEIDRQVDALRSDLGGEEALERMLADAGMSREDLRSTFARQLLVLSYIDERLGARVFVDLDDVEEYFDNELAPRLRAEGSDVPRLEDVREDIRALLRERRLDEEIEEWTRDLRREADIQDLLEEPPPAPSAPGRPTHRRPSGGG